MIIELRRVGTYPGGGGEGGTWVFFGWVCAAQNSKLAPHSKKNSPKILLIPRSRIRPKSDTPFYKWANFLYSILGCKEYNSLLVNALNRIFKSNLTLNNFKWLLTKLELSCFRNIIPRSRKRL